MSSSVPKVAACSAVMGLAACAPSLPVRTTPSPTLSQVLPSTVSLTPGPSVQPCAPVVTPTPGIDNGAAQVGPDSWDVFVTTNQWIGQMPGDARLYHVWAGVTGEQANPPRIPAVWVRLSTLTADRCTVVEVSDNEYLDKAATGPLAITSIRGTDVALRTGRGEALVFDVIAGRFRS